MNEDTKLKLVVAAAGLAVAATATGIAYQVNKRRLKKPLPGTTQIYKMYVVKEKTPKK